MGPEGGVPVFERPRGELEVLLDYLQKGYWSKWSRSLGGGGGRSWEAENGTFKSVKGGELGEEDKRGSWGFPCTLTTSTILRWVGEGRLRPTNRETLKRGGLSTGVSASKKGP